MEHTSVLEQERPTEHEKAPKVEKVEVARFEHTPRNTLVLLSVKAPMACRLLIKDLEALIPDNVTKDSKIKENFSLSEISELAEINDCDNVFLIETRRKSPAPILWTVTRIAEEGTQKEVWDVVKFVLTGVYTMKELKFLGNPLTDTQMTTLFSGEFEKSKGLRRIKRMLNNIFNTTQAAGKESAEAKNSADKIASFFLVEKQIFVRFYHISKKTTETERIEAERKRRELEREKERKEKKEQKEQDGSEESQDEEEEEKEDPNIQMQAGLSSTEVPWTEVTEIGPRFTLHPRETDLDDEYKPSPEKEEEEEEE
ncbi:ribosome biogenesis protein BRX1 [Nematocida sp. AWRm77]|nr:ribosome biogenesis protein BRX1 [Nematocida sp. AWRm77]